MFWWREALFAHVFHPIALHIHTPNRVIKDIEYLVTPPEKKSFLAHLLAEWKKYKTHSWW